MSSPNFELHSKYAPAGDQPTAISQLTQGYIDGKKCQTLLGVTGSGKTFTMANVIANLNTPTLVISHNKTLAAQLYKELKDFFPKNAVEYFVSYYDYYQPEAYVASRDLYIEKDAAINEEIERLRLSATSSLIDRRDVIVVATVSCIYGIGNPDNFRKMKISLRKGNRCSPKELAAQLVDLQYSRNDMVLERGNFRIRGDSIEIYPAYLKSAVRIDLDWEEIASIKQFDPLTSEILSVDEFFVLYPAKHFVMPDSEINKALDSILAEMEDQVQFFESKGKILEAQRIKTRTLYDVEMMREMGTCPGIENYSRILDGRSKGQRPAVLIDYFPDDFLTIVDESHVTLPQIGGMFEGDRSRKTSLVEFGFRLPSALDNRPLYFSEFESLLNKTLFVSATPSKIEAKLSEKTVEQIIRPTGLIDPEISVRPSDGQIEDLYNEIKARIAVNERVLVTTLTKKMAEELSLYFLKLGLKVKYLHSEIETLERVEIIKELRSGKIDILIGINLLREGLDMPEVSLVAILDADKIGFLRSATSLIQTIGRAARNVNGKVIMYADRNSIAMEEAISETNRRREKQVEYNQLHHITPQSIQKSIEDILVRKGEPSAKVENEVASMISNVNLFNKAEKKKVIKELEKRMLEHAKNMEFEEAALLRDQIRALESNQV